MIEPEPAAELFRIPDDEPPVANDAFRKSIIDRLTAAQQQAVVNESQETEAKPNLDVMDAFKGASANDLLAEVLRDRTQTEQVDTKQLDEMRMRAIESSQIDLLGDLIR